MEPEEASIPAMALASAARWSNRDAIVDGEARLSFQGVADTMIAVAKSLLAAGIEVGDRVAVWAPNSVAYVPVALGIHAVGALLVPLNTRMKGEEAAFILEKSDAAMLFTPSEFLGTDYEASLREAGPNVRALRAVVELPGPGQLTCRAFDAFLATGDSIDPVVVHRRLASVGPEDVCDIIFTSGTTGQPKGVMLRHGASLKGFRMYNDAGYQLREGDRHVVATPFFHCFGYKAGWMLGLMVGATTYPVAVFDGEVVLQTIARESITHMPGSPTMFTAMLDHPRRKSYDVRSFRSTLISAATIPEQLVHRVRNELGVQATLTGYGLTENHALVSTSSPDDPPSVVATTAGRIFDELEFRVVDDDGNDVADGEQGELLVRGFLLMSGYYDEPEVTATTIVDGWLHTGDVVKMSADRYVSITDRKKDLYIMGGFNVAPAEVERVLLDLEGVAQVAVVGMPDDHFGEVGAAFIIPTVDSSLNVERVIEYSRVHLANYKVPRHVEFVTEFPLNATGKVLKRVLRDRLSHEENARNYPSPRRPL